MPTIHPYLVLKELHKVTGVSHPHSYSLVIDWDGASSKYLTPHLTLEATLNLLVPLPGRPSGMVQFVNNP